MRAFLYKVCPARNVPARRRNAAAGVFDKAACHQVCPALRGFFLLGELTIAVIHHHKNVRLGVFGRPADGLNICKAQRIAGRIAPAALDITHFGALALLCNQGKVRPAVLQRHLVILHAPLFQAAPALVTRQANNAQQSVVRRARRSHHAVARAQHAKQRHAQRVRTREKALTEQGCLGPHGFGKHLFQLIAAGVIRPVARGAHQVLAAHTAVCKGTQHFQLVVFFNLFQRGKLPGAQPARLFVQLQQSRAQFIKLFYHFL